MPELTKEQKELILLALDRYWVEQNDADNKYVANQIDYLKMQLEEVYGWGI